MTGRDRILRRVRLLWQKADHASTPPEEAQTARRLAGHLMTEHGVTAEDVEASRPQPRPAPPPAPRPARAVVYGVATHTSTTVGQSVGVRMGVRMRMRIQFEDGSVLEIG